MQFSIPTDNYVRRQQHCGGAVVECLFLFKVTSYVLAGGNYSLIYQSDLSCFEWKQKKNKSRWKALCSNAALGLWGLCSGCLKCTRCWDYADTGDFDPRECCLRFTVLCSTFFQPQSWYTFTVYFCLGLLGQQHSNPKVWCSSASAATIKYLVYL